MLVVAAGLVLALGAAVLAARHASPSEVSPVSPSGEPWHAFWTWGVTAAFTLYAVGTWLARKGALSLRVAVLTAVVVQVLPLAAPLLLSKDVYLYWSEARIAIVHHANPYHATPDAYPRTGPQVCLRDLAHGDRAYGPAWEALGTVPAVVAEVCPPGRARLPGAALLGVLAATSSSHAVPERGRRGAARLEPARRTALRRRRPQRVDDGAPRVRHRCATAATGGAHGRRSGIQGRSAILLPRARGAPSARRGAGGSGSLAARLPSLRSQPASTAPIG